MTTRTFNYTGRIHIKQECIDAALTGRSSGAPCLEVDLDWEHVPQIFDLPGDSRVYVDAFHGMSFMRFDHGTLEDPQTPSDPRITDLDSWGGADVVVRIVNHQGLLLARSRGHTITRASPDTATSNPLITHNFSDLGQRPWNLEVREEMQIPVLHFNDKWWNAAESRGTLLNTDPTAMGLVMPNVLESMLKWMLIENESDPYQLADDPTWKGGWMRFARSLHGSPPPALDDHGRYQSIQEVVEWIDGVVGNFCERHGITSNLVSIQGGR